MKCSYHDTSAAYAASRIRSLEKGGAMSCRALAWAHMAALHADNHIVYAGKGAG